jgi:hypothetical protein
MASTGNLPRIEITQTLRTSSATGTTPLLVPTLVGPCFQIVDFLDVDTGAVNTDAYAGIYAPLTSNTFSYPNLDTDADVVTGTVSVWFRFGTSSTYAEVDSAYLTITSSSVTIDAGATTTTPTVYIQYRALKKGVLVASSSLTGSSCGVKLESLDDITTYLGTVDTRNPLGYAAWLSLSTATVPVRCLGVDDVAFSLTANEYDGTTAAFTSALEGIETCDDSYAITCLTFNESVHTLLSTHVTSLSAATRGKERIGFICSSRYNEYPREIVLSGIGSTDGSSNYKLNVNCNVADLIDTNYDSVIMTNGTVEYPITVAADDGDGGVLTSSVEFLDSEGDAYTNREFSVYRIAKPASTKSEMADVIGTNAYSYGNRRLRYVFPPYVQITEDGVDKLINGYYACAILCALRCEVSPSKPLTKYALPLLSGVKGANGFFSDTNLDSMVGNGVWILNDDSGTVQTIRAVTTDVTSLETMEDNVTVEVDYFSKILRIALKNFLGKNVITKDLIKYSLGPTITAVINQCINTQIIGDAKVTSFKQSETNPDTIEVTIEVTPLYALNVIKITIYI